MSGGKSFLIRDLLGDVLRACDRLQRDRLDGDDVADVSSSHLKRDTDEQDVDGTHHRFKIEADEVKCQPGEYTRNYYYHKL